MEFCLPGRRRKGWSRNSWMQEVTTGNREREREELTTWKGSTGKNREGKYNFSHRKISKHWYSVNKLINEKYISCRNEVAKVSYGLTLLDMKISDDFCTQLNIYTYIYIFIYIYFYFNKKRILRRLTRCFFISTKNLRMALNYKTKGRRDRGRSCIIWENSFDVGTRQ